MDKEQDPLGVKVTPLYTILLSRLLKFYNNLKWKLVKYELTNNTEKSMHVFIESEIANLSYKYPEDFELPPKSKDVQRFHSPPADADKVNALSKNKSAPLYYKITYTYTEDGQERLSRNDHFDVTLLARNVIYWAIPDPQDNSRRISLLDYLVEWITPDDQTVERTLKSAISNQRGLQIGYHKGQEPKRLVLAIYDELQKNVQLTYHNPQRDITIPNQGQIDQVVRLPHESLENGFANCIDGAVLYANLIEAAGLDALIVFSARKVENSSKFNEGHALVGWRKEKGSKQYEFLETTITQSVPFQDALKVGNKKYQKLIEDGWFDHEPFGSESFAYRLLIKETRKKINGILEEEEPPPPEPPPPEPPPSECGKRLGIGNHFAVIVGTNSYEAGDIYHQKQICPYDAETLYQQLMVNSFHPSRLHLLTDTSLEWLASKRILSHLYSIAGASTSADLLLFYYSGAIKQDGQNYYLYTLDMLPSKLESAVVPLALVSQIMVQAPAMAKVIILDIYNIEIDAQSQDREQQVEEFMQALLQQLEGLTVLASYKEKHKELACSLFTHALVEQLEQLPGSGNCISVQHIYDNVSSNEIKLYPPAPYQAKQTIVCCPGQETRSYFLLAYRYLIHIQKSLERVQEILMQKEVTKDHVQQAIKLLSLIDEDCVQPETLFSLIDENSLMDTLYELYQGVKRLMVQELQPLLSQPKATITQNTYDSVYKSLLPTLYSFARKANELRAIIMPNEA